MDSIYTKAIDMISSDNQPNRATTSDEDFTEVHYRQLLRAARVSYRFATYDAIPWDTRFVIWRHDLDYSINRAAALAVIESEEGVTATYFVNPRSEYYNPFEPKQVQLLKHILSLGHRLGLHFDAAFHNIQNEEQLHIKVAQEGRWLEEAFGVRPDAFSFHNPGADNLQCGADQYGGLTNCYSQRFKTEVPYCSDSNGYWRFRRLHDVLTAATDSCLQVLTHPGWWQSKPMPPRQRIFRSAYGRAQATMNDYDAGLAKHGRINHAGLADLLCFLRPIHPRAFNLCDYLWNQGHLAALFAELWRIHECQINQFCKAIFLKEWQVPAADVNAFFADRPFAIDGSSLFSAVFGTTWQQAVGVDGRQYKDLVALRNSLINSGSSAAGEHFEKGCVLLCCAMDKLAAWGKSQPISYDGMSHLGSIGIPTYKTANGTMYDKLEEIAVKTPNFPSKRWVQFKAEIGKISASGTTK
jgi:hypothetical protein